MSEVKVNKISPRSGTTVTLGDSGDTFTIPSGATINNQGTATNFGATGSASWNTTVKTGDFTAVAGEGYFVNTTSGEVDVALPAGTPGAVVAIKDYAKTFDTNNCILVQNGSDKIGGSTVNAILSTEGIAVTLIFIDSTQGWLVTDDGLQSAADTNVFMIATGGTITESGNCKIHTFTGPGTFTVTKTALAAANNEVSYMVVAGGGGGGAGPAGNPSGNNATGGAGGAGGFRETKSPVTPYTASPLDGQPSAPNRITVTAASFPITVGGGGAGAPYTGTPAHPGANGSNGVNSTFSTITSAGGGGGAPDTRSGSPGGSGGGGGGEIGPAAGGTGNTPPVSPAQGQNGGAGGAGPPEYGSGGGGGATAVGQAGATSTPTGNGGAGATTSINGTPTAFAGGGGGGAYSTPAPARPVGGAGGGGSGGVNGTSATNGTANTGGGAGGARGTPCNGGTPASGGSGIVIIRYKFQ